jgi:hypothetical protein
MQTFDFLFDLLQKTQPTFDDHENFVIFVEFAFPDVDGLDTFDDISAGCQFVLD